YPDTGKYCVTLTVANKYGCLGSTQQCIIIEPVYTFYIPNAFTPNHDGENDVFMPYGTYICGYEMYIFDRWGQQLYHTFNINAGWDGVVEGKTKKAEEDTYIYLIKVTDCIQYNEHQYIGKVSLVK
ncbi:MAG TPA: gliding motility-associated C-terminal domain-containing protein, partial [Bacteroidia bacterium]|nr:gliding motility-associated C-terminal domain-containing protein [Bacteroidia bacterium]